MTTQSNRNLDYLVTTSIVLGIVAFMLFVSPFLLQNDFLGDGLKEYRPLIKGNLFRMLTVLLGLPSCGIALYVLDKKINEDRNNKLRRSATFSFALNVFLIVMTLSLSLLGTKVSYEYSVISSSLIP